MILIFQELILILPPIFHNKLSLMITEPPIDMYPCRLKKSLPNLRIGTQGYVKLIPNSDVILCNVEQTTADFIFSLNQDFDGVIFHVMLNEVQFL